MAKEQENGKLKSIKVKNKITVRTLKAIEPKAEVYELSPYSRYLVTLKKSPLSMGNENLSQKAQAIMNILTNLQIPAAILIGVDDDVKIMELDYDNK